MAAALHMIGQGSTYLSTTDKRQNHWSKLPAAKSRWPVQLPMSWAWWS
jgi:hypothetical protein